MFSKNMKSVLIITIIFVMSLSSIALYAECDMMAMIAKKGHYISWMNSTSSSFDAPNGYFQWQKDRSFDDVVTVKHNDDGYGVIYYPEDGSFHYEELGYDDQAWYQNGYETYYTGGSSAWKVALDDAEAYIMDNDTQASIVMGHDRQGTGGNGNHPFRLTWNGTTYTFMHNGFLDYQFKSNLNNYLTYNDPNWQTTYPPNWIGAQIDSEIFFHYLMSYIIDAGGDILPGLHNALNETSLEYNATETENVWEELSLYISSNIVNFILSDGTNLYVFRNTPLSDTDHSIGYYANNHFTGIRTYGTGDYDIEIERYELAVFTPYGHPTIFSDNGLPNGLNQTRMRYFLKPNINIPDYVFLKGEVNSDINYPFNAENPFVWITDDVTIDSDIEVTEGTNIGVLNHVDIDVNAKLTLNAAAGIHLNHASAINIDGDGELFLGWGSTITGAVATTVEATPPGQPVGGERQVLGDRIIAQNGGIITTGFQNPGDEIIIRSSNKYNYNSLVKWDGISIQNPSDDADYWFVNCDISGISKLSIENVGLSARNIANLNLYQTDFSDNNQLLVRGGHILTIDDCDITNNAGGISVYDSPATIENSTITGNGIGVNMNYACNEESVIENCEINNNDGNGLVFRDKIIYFDQNSVQENLYNGIVSYSNGIFASFEDNDISNNEYTEYGGFDESYTWANNNNTIADLGYINSSDQYILKVFGWVLGDDQVNVSGNNIDNGDDERFWPSYDAFYFGGIIEDEKIMFDSASDDMNAGNYVAARSTFEQLITDYPESIEAAASLQKIYFIENYTDQNYDDLLLYVESIPTVEGSTMHRVKCDIITKTYMQKEEYNTAINLLETVIADPANEIVLTDALIDQAYCYVKLIEEGSRALPEICTFKPQNFSEFQQIVSELENKLYETEEPIEEEIIPVNVTLSNYPNPFNPTTTINFSLPEDSDVELSIYNVKGQKVRTLTNEFLEKGTHSIEWNGKDTNNKSVSSGIYFYKISADKETAMKKMLLLK